MAIEYKRYTLQQLIDNIEEFKEEKCIAGYPIKDWLDADTWIQWNPQSCSYQLYFGAPQPVWSFGFTLYEITSPYFLIGIFEYLFPCLPLKFNEETMKALVRDRKHSVHRIPGETFESLEDMDEQYRQFPDAIIVSDEYMRKGKD